MLDLMTSDGAAWDLGVLKQSSLGFGAFYEMS